MRWDDDWDLRLHELCAQTKLAAREMAIILNVEFRITPPLTRDAVKRRALRIGADLPLPSPQEAAMSSPLRFQIPSEYDDGTVNPMPPINRLFEPPRISRERLILFDDPNPDAPGVLLANAASGDCRRPLNNPPRGRMIDLRVCGEPVTRMRGETGYCDDCFRTVYGGVSLCGIFVHRSFDEMKAWSNKRRGK